MSKATANLVQRMAMLEIPQTRLFASCSVANKARQVRRGSPRTYRATKSPAWRCRWLPEMPLALDCYSPVHIWQITCSENASRSDKRLRHYFRAQNGRGRTMTNAAQKALLWNLILEIKQFISPSLCSLCGWTFAHIQIVACLLTTRGLNLNNVINTGDVLLWLFTPPVSKWVCNFSYIFLVSGLKGKTGANKFW